MSSEVRGRVVGGHPDDARPLSETELTALRKHLAGPNSAALIGARRVLATLEQEAPCRMILAVLVATCAGVKPRHQTVAFQNALAAARATLRNTGGGTFPDVISF